MRRMYITEKEYAGLKKLLELVDNEVFGLAPQDEEDEDSPLVLVINKKVHLEQKPGLMEDTASALYSGKESGFRDDSESIIGIIEE